MVLEFAKFEIYMRHALIIALSIILCTSCSDDTEGLDSFVETHAAELENYALSAGTSTLFNNSSKAFDAAISR